MYVALWSENIASNCPTKRTKALNLKGEVKSEWKLCHINDKLCLIIIDNGSCVNVTSTRVLDKLGLKTIPYDKPYKQSWLKEEKIKVTKQVLINFLIRNFKDEVLCDVVPMKATHILLGRSWKFDKKVFYDGHANTYVFFLPRQEVQSLTYN